MTRAGSYIHFSRNQKKSRIYGGALLLVSGLIACGIAVAQTPQTDPKPPTPDTVPLATGQTDGAQFVQGLHSGSPPADQSTCSVCGDRVWQVDMFDPRVENDRFKWDIEARFHPDSSLPRDLLERHLGFYSLYFTYNPRAFDRPHQTCVLENDIAQESNPNGMPKYTVAIDTTDTNVLSIAYTTTTPIRGTQDDPPAGQEGDYFIELTGAYQRLFTVSCPMVSRNEPAGIQFDYRGWDQMYTQSVPTASQPQNLLHFLRVVSTSLEYFPLDGTPGVVAQKMYNNNYRVDLILNEPATAPLELRFSAALVYPVEAQLSVDGLTLFLRADIANLPFVINEVEVEVLPNGLGTAQNRYQTTTVIARLPAPSIYDPEIAIAAFDERRRGENRLALHIAPLEDGESGNNISDFDLTGDSNKVIDRIVFINGSGDVFATYDSTSVTSVGILQTTQGDNVVEEIYIYEVILPPIDNDDTTANVFFQEDGLTLTADDNMGFLRPRQTRALGISVPDNVAPLLTHRETQLIRLSDSSGLSPGQVRLRVRTVFDSDDTLERRNFSPAPFPPDIGRTFEINAWDETNTNVIDSITLSAFQARVNSSPPAITIEHTVVAAATAAFYSVRIDRPEHFAEFVRNPEPSDVPNAPAGELETPVDQRAQVPPIRLVDLNDAPNTIIEKSTGAVVQNLTLEARGEDGNPVSGTVTWTIVEGTRFDLFTIGETTATAGITVTRALDRDDGDPASYELTVQASHSTQGIAEIVVDVRMLDLDVDLEVVGSPGVLLEDTARGNNDGALVAGVTLRAILGSDISESADITYRIIDDPSPFAIVADPLTDEAMLRVEDTIDFETTPSYVVIAHAEVNDNGIVRDSNRVTLAIVVLDVVEALTIRDADPQANTLLETISGEVAGIALQARNENDTLVAATTWTIVENSRDGDGQNYFSIETRTGVLRTRLALDYETQTTHNLSLRVALQNRRDTLIESDVYPIVVNVVNLSDEVRIDDLNSDPNRLANDAVSGTEVSGLTLQATDESDRILNNQDDDLLWSLVSDGNISERFAISTATGQLSWSSAGTPVDFLPPNERTFRLSVIATIQNELGMSIQSAPEEIEIEILPPPIRVRTRVFLESILRAF